VAADYRERESHVVRALERAPRLLERLQPRGRRYRVYVEAAVLEAARKERVLLMGRWSTIFLRGIRHAVRVRVCAPVEVRAIRVMERFGIDREEAARRIRAYDEGVRARMRQVFELDWTDPLLYDLVINTETVTVESGVRQVLDLVEAPEFQPTPESRAALADRALAARVRAAVKAATGLDLAAEASGPRVRLGGVVSSEAESEAAVASARAVTGVETLTSDVKVFRRPVR
jgi:cytidylate kinase